MLVERQNGKNFSERLRPTKGCVLYTAEDLRLCVVMSCNNKCFETERRTDISTMRISRKVPRADPFQNDSKQDIMFDDVSQLIKEMPENDEDVNVEDTVQTPEISHCDGLHRLSKPPFSILNNKVRR
ncbi:hypothetical protein TNCV_1309601 [Trichonephila clavipes]|nr:hypothetical protein TNCV_1309601 [Trichonephila clavipes]